MCKREYRRKRGCVLPQPGYTSQTLFFALASEVEPCFVDRVVDDERVETKVSVLGQDCSLRMSAPFFQVGQDAEDLPEQLYASQRGPLLLGIA